MKHHVAIIHGQSTFSTLQCGICNRKYYDVDHFQGHIRETPSCTFDFLEITTVPLAGHVEKAFHSLVNQMMKPVHIQSGQFPSLPIGGIVSPCNVQLQSNSQNSCKKSLAEVKMECIDGDSESPATISATSMLKDDSLDAQAHPHEQMDVQHQDEDGLDREGPRSIERHIHNVEGASKLTSIMEENGQRQTRCKPNVGDLQLECSRICKRIDCQRIESSIVKQNDDKEQLRQKPSDSDLRLHCQQIIVKRHHKNRLTCAIYRGSIAAVANGILRYYNTLRHAQRHANPPLFHCKLCQFKSNTRESMQAHQTRKHSASDQYIDTTVDRMDELMQLVTQCFDHGFHTQKSKVACRISSRQQEIGHEIIERDQAMSNEDPGSDSVAGVSKLRINQSKVADCRGSKGIKQLFTRNQPRKPRYTVGRKKQGEFPVILEKNYFGTWYGAARASKLSKDVKISMSNGPSASNKDSTMRRLVLPMDILAKKRLCLEKVKKLVKNGKLKCKLCQQQITVSNNSSYFGNIHKAYFHAMTHVRDMDVFECITCHYRTSNQAVMYNHVARKHNSDQRKFIDHRAKYFPKILEMFLACFTTESDVASAIGMEGHQDEKMESACSLLEPMDSTRDQDTNSVCVKCGYKTAFPMLFRKHQKIMHAE